MKHLFKTSLVPLICYAAVLALLVACGNEAPKNSTGTTASSEKLNNKVESNASESSNLATNEDTQNSTTPKPSTNVEDYYKLWAKKLIADAKKQGMPDGQPEIQVKDIANGYMKVGLMSLGITGYQTMTLWVAQNGQTTFGTLSHGCGPVCSSGFVQFYEMKDGQLKEVTDQVLSKKAQTRLAKKAQEIMSKPTFNPSEDADFWTVLPHKGTTIQMGIMKSNLANDKKKMINLMAELQYNVTNNTFKPHFPHVCFKKQKMIRGGQKVHYVKFPGQNGVYQLITNGATLFCVNPNGSRQEFIPEDKYISRGKNGLIEYLYTQGPPPSYFYSNNKSPKKISLTMVKGDMMTMVFKVKFPGSSKVYQLKSLSNGNILCTNPDGSQQMFVKEN